MRGALPPVTAVHLAVLADADLSGADTLCAVLAYDGRGRRHLHPIANAPSTELLIRLLGCTTPQQLQLPVISELPDPSSSGRCWRTWVLPSVPHSLRTLPPEQLAAALVERLLAGAAS